MFVVSVLAIVVSCMALVSNGNASSGESLLSLARDAIRREDADEAFSFLSQAYAADSNIQGLMSCFEDVFRLRIKLGFNLGENVVQDRFGLSSLLTDQQRYEEAAQELRILLQEVNADDNRRKYSDVRDKAASMLFRSQAAICQWDNIHTDRLELLISLDDFFADKEADNKQGRTSNETPPIHPFEALKWSCISLASATKIASFYAKRAEKLSINKECSKSCDLVNRIFPVPSTTVSREILNTDGQKKIRLGYISPDFTAVHPLAFLMQDVFRLHNKDRFEINLYSLSSIDDGSSNEVSKIRDAANKWIVFSSRMGQTEIANALKKDNLDIIVDLCGFTGTSLVAEVMSHRVAPLQIAYMGFPGSSGASYIDYMICDQTVVPPSIPSIRKYYTELLITMPHCYFVCSHKYVDIDYNNLSRLNYGLPEDGFVFTCHSRPDKIDPETFRSWLRVLCKVKAEGRIRHSKRESNAVLWLLRSCNEMESNLRQIAENEFELDKDALIFTDVAARLEHLRRLSLSDLFLDTPSYNAHTVGCDSLYAGVPMVSLLRSDISDRCEQIEGINTEKLASRVGASLLKSVNLDELVASNMEEYEQIMKSCARNKNNWYDDLKDRLKTQRDSCALFDTERWVRNLEAGFTKLVSLRPDERNSDVYIEDDE